VGGNEGEKETEVGHHLPCACSSSAGSTGAGWHTHVHGIRLLYTTSDAYSHDCMSMIGL
jgi:hypothetical protein